MMDISMILEPDLVTTMKYWNTSPEIQVFLI